MLYIKEADKISDFLKIIGCSKAVLYYEEIRVYRDAKNKTNRLNNCEQANMDRVIDSAMEQLNYIRILEDNMAIELLDDKTKELLDSIISNDKKIQLTNLDYAYQEKRKESLRKASSKILNSLTNSSKLIFGGAADLSSSTLTYLTDKGDLSSDDYNGRNIFFGVREFAMASIANGLALSGYRPFVSTYLTFSDYLKPALRLSCLMNLPVTYIFTHDSITVGKDGPTHQAVEQLVGLRATPN